MAVSKLELDDWAGTTGLLADKQPSGCGVLAAAPISLQAASGRGACVGFVTLSCVGGRGLLYYLSLD